MTAPEIIIGSLGGITAFLIFLIYNECITVYKGGEW